MSEVLRERFLEPAEAFAHPLTLGIVLGVAAVLVLAPLLVFVLARLGRLREELRHELLLRCLTWAILAPLLIVPVLMGPGWTILMVAVLSLWCFREYARATGLFRHLGLSSIVVVGIALLALASLDQWYGLFVALWPLVVCAIIAAAILPDRPQGYIQRVALAIMGYLLIGAGLAHLGYFANHAGYRPIVLLLLLAVELNDVFAYLVGKTLGRRKLIPNTSPNKTIAGAAGAVVLTTALVLTLGRAAFAGTPLGAPLHLLALGLIISTGGQLGDLTLSSIKRDLGIKDIAATLPGHGGVLDRFNSMLLVAPAVFHYVHYFDGIGVHRSGRLFTGG